VVIEVVNHISLQYVIAGLTPHPSLLSLRELIIPMDAPGSSALEELTG